MGMFDDLEVSSKATVVPEEFRQRYYQTKDLDCDGSFYRIDSANQFLKVENPVGKPERLFYANNLNQDVGCYDFGYDLVLQIRNGIVVDCLTGTSDADYWDGVEPIWMPFIESESRG